MLILSVIISQFNIHSVPNNHLCISNILTVQSHLSKAEIPDQFKHQISDASSRPHTSVLLLFTPQVRDLLSPNSSPANGSTHLISLLTDQLHPPSAPVQTNWWPVQQSRVRPLHHSGLMSGCSAGDETEE